MRSLYARANPRKAATSPYRAAEPNRIPAAFSPSAHFSATNCVAGHALPVSCPAISEKNPADSNTSQRSQAYSAALRLSPNAVNVLNSA